RSRGRLPDHRRRGRGSGGRAGCDGDGLPVGARGGSRPRLDPEGLSAMGSAALVAALLLPLSGAALIRLFGRHLRPHAGPAIATVAVGLAHVAAWIAFLTLLAEPPEARI